MFPGGEVIGSVQNSTVTVTGSAWLGNENQVVSCQTVGVKRTGRPATGKLKSQEKKTGARKDSRPRREQGSTTRQRRQR